MAVGHGTGDSKKQAEQRAAFSVSQDSTTSIDDEDSAKILDRIDKIAN
jgi:ribonuclease-3